MRINVKDLGPISSRESGREAKRQLDDLLEKHGHVEIDLSEVSVVSSSWADEVVGRTVEKMGITEFSNRVKLINIGLSNPVITRAIMQRLPGNFSHSADT